MRKFSCLTLFCAGVVLAACHDATDPGTAPDLADKRVGIPSIRATDLGPVSAWDINDRGTVVVSDNSWKLYQWTHPKGLTLVGPGANSSINASGMMVTPAQDGSAIVYAPDGSALAILVVEGKRIVPAGISDSAVVVGTLSDLSTGRVETNFRWSRQAGLTLIDFGQPALIAAISPRGHIVGYTKQAEWFISTSTEPFKRLGILGVPEAINDNDQIVGTDNLGRPATYSPAGAPELAPVAIGPHTALIPSALNDEGTVVGAFTDGDPNDNSELHAFYWSVKGGFVDLGAGVARAINGRGQVVGQSPFAFEGRATLWRVHGKH